MKNKAQKKVLSYLPYPLLGLLVFHFSSALDINYFAKGYISILALQAGILIIYLANRQLKKIEF